MSTNLTTKDLEHLNQCHPVIVKIITNAAQDADCPPFMIVDGGRTMTEQKALLKRGATTTLRSRHLIAVNGYSHAIDFIPIINNKPNHEDWEHFYPLADAVKRIATALGYTSSAFEWGGNWKSFKDGAHWQLSWTKYPGTNNPKEHALDLKVDEVYKTDPVITDQAFNKSIPLVLAHEGGYVNHPADKGGPTNKGITLATFKRYIKPKGTASDLQRLTDEQAITVYKRHYWDAVSGDMLPDGVSHAVFDYAVNSGPSKAIKALQTIVGVTADGKIGPITRKNVYAMPARTIIINLISYRLAYLKRLSNWFTFGKGWTKRLERVESEALGLIKASPQITAASNIPPGATIFSFFFSLIRRLLGGSRVQ